MRILLLVQNYYPMIQSCAHLMHHLAVEMVERGHEVILATPLPSLSEPRTLTSEGGITILRVRSLPFRGVPLPLRALAEWRLSGTLWRGGKDFFRQHRCELVISYSPPIFFGALVRRLKRLWRCPHYLILRDIFPQWSIDAGLISPGGAIHRFFEHYELELYDSAEIIGVETEANLEHFRNRGLLEKSSFEVLYNWTALEDQDVADTRYRSDLDLGERVIFVYGGNFGVAQDAMVLVRLAAAMRDEPDAFFLLAGDGSERTHLERAIADRDLQNIRLLPPVDRRTYLGMVAEADVGLVTLRRELGIQNVPSKVLDYMYLRKPILGAINPGNIMREIVEESRAGLISWNGDGRGLEEHTRKLTADAALRRELGSNARHLLESRFSSSRAAEQILSHV